MAIKESQEKKGLLIVLISCCVFLLFWRTVFPPTDIIYDGKYRDAEQISLDEMHSFLSAWAEYVKFDPSSIEKNLYDEENKKALPVSFKLKRWIKSKGWTPDRFFYVKQRMWKLVASVDAQIEAFRKAEIDRIKKDEEYRKNLHYLSYHKRKINFRSDGNLTTREMEMIAPKIGYIRSVLEDIKEEAEEEL